MEYGWRIVGTVFVAQLFMVGFFTYSYPLLVVPIEKEFGSGMEKISYALIVSSLIGITLPLVVGPLVDRWSARFLMMIGAVCLTLGLVGLSMAQNVYQFIVCVGLLMGSGNILLGPIAGQAVISRWFTSSRGRALGLAAIGTSLGGMLLPRLMAWGIEEIGWRTTLQLVAGLVLIIVWPLLLFVFRDHPSDLGLEPEGGGSAAAAAPAPVGSSLDILRMRAFWALSSCLALFLAAYSATLANLGKFAEGLGVDGTSQADLMTVLAFSGLLGKLAFGFLADRLPLKLSLWAAIGLAAIAIGSFSLEPNYPALLVCSSIMGLATGGILPVWGAMVGTVFGVANFGRTMGLQGPTIALVAIPTFWMAGWIYDHPRPGEDPSFALAFQIFVGMLCLSAASLTALRIPSGQPGDETP